MSEAAAPPTPDQLAALFWEIAGFTVHSYGIFVWAGAILTGIVCMQCLDYIQTSARDPMYLKAMAIGITALQIASSCFEVVGHSMQDKLVLSRTISPNVHLPWTDGWIILTSCLSGLISQAYFGRLVYRMTRATSSSRKWSLPWIALFATLATAVAGLGITCFVFFIRVRKHSWMPQAYVVNLSGRPVDLYLSWLAAAAALDVTLATILIINFVRDIRKDGFASTNSLLTSLAVSTLETFSLTAVVAVVDIICASIIGHVPYITTAKLECVCYFLTVVIERLYCFSFLWTLKRHSAVRDLRNAPTSQHKSFGTNSPHSTRKSPQRFRSPGVGGVRSMSERGDGEGDVEANGIELARAGEDTESRGSVNSFVDGVRVETTRTTRVDKSEPDAYGLPGRPVLASWKVAQRQ